MKDPVEEVARCFYEAKKELEFRRITYSKTTLKAAIWKECSGKERLEWLEAARRVLADKEIMQILMNRVAGM